MKTAVIIGNYGVGNLGDDDMLNRVIALAQSKGYSPVICCGNSSRLMSKGYEACPFLPSGLRSLLKTVWSKRYRESVRQTKVRFCRAEVIIFGGGGLFVDVHWAAILLWWIHLRYAVRLKKKVILLSQTFCVTRSLSRLLWVPWLKKTSIITVRDSESQRLLESLKITSIFLPDITFTPKPTSISGLRTRSVILSLCQWGMEETQLQALRSTVQSLISQGYTVSGTVFQSEHDDDRLIYHRLSLPIPLLVERREITMAIQTAELLIGMRYHAILLATRSSTPFVALSYQSKVENFLSDTGLQEQGIAMQKVNEELLQQKVACTLRERDTITRNLMAIDADLSRQAQAYANLEI